MRRFVIPLAIMLLACSLPWARPAPDAGQVIASFRAAGLEVENVRAGTKEMCGISPCLCQATWFDLPSQGEHQGGQVLVCRDEKERDVMVKYFNRLGEASPLFRSWVFTKDLVVLQLSGQLDEGLARRYEKALP